MEKVYQFIGVALLLFGVNTAIGQDNCWVAPCDRVAPCDPCGGRVASSCLFSNWAFGGWVETGVYTNSRGFNNNGPMHTDSNRRTDFLMNQLYLFTEREMDTRRGFDWGARLDLVYGIDAGSKQTWGDETFDFNWGMNRHGYGMSAYQLYGTLGYRDLSVKAGKFYTPVGWEGSASLDNFFYSHSLCYWIEPATHMGGLATYNLTDRLTVSGGWTAGTDSSFANPNNNHTVLSGLEYALGDNATIYYWFNAGRQFNTESEERYNHFVQSFCFEWNLTNRFTYVMQYNLHNDNVRGGEGRYSSYGINNHFLYKLNDRWGAGMRVEWLRDNGGYVTEEAGTYYQFTWGLNWNPRKNVSIRPEVRYDWVKGATPFGRSDSFGGHPTVGTRSTQVSGGCGIVISF